MSAEKRRVGSMKPRELQDALDWLAGGKAWTGENRDWLDRVKPPRSWWQREGKVLAAAAVLGALGSVVVFQGLLWLL